MYTKSARFYDAIYRFKDYQAEAEIVHNLIQQHSTRPVETLLDVATGTGAHLPFLQAHYTVEGLDLEPGMLAIARERLPDVPFHQASMIDFDLGKQYDAVICLFSSIGYVLTDDALRQTMTTFARHLREGGVLIVEPWLAPDVYEVGHLSMRSVDDADLKISRVMVSEREGDISVMAMHHLFATPEDGVTHFVEMHRLRMYSRDTYLDAITQAGLNAHHREDGLTGRGLYIAVKP